MDLNANIKIMFLKRERSNNKLINKQIKFCGKFL